ncbi:MAG TPA: type II toxin-antitoxin system VapC family toxin [Gaiellaceae bacterium]|nr:type II toxin-antitoxin system VapC family toxin [Gaiellaceae bacterium]
MRNVSDVAYLDASALVKLSLEEDHSAALRQATPSWAHLVSSRLAVVEVLRTARRRDPAAEPTARDVLSHAALVALTDRILYAATQLHPGGLRSLDAIHLATALRLGDALAAFVSYDERHLETAATLGLPVVLPR